MRDDAKAHEYAEDEKTEASFGELRTKFHGT
jgi:hypothetical protein